MTKAQIFHEANQLLHSAKRESTQYGRAHLLPEDSPGNGKSARGTGLDPSHGQLLFDGNYGNRAAVLGLNGRVGSRRGNLGHNDLRQPVVRHFKDLGAGFGAQAAGDAAASVNCCFH